MPAPRPELENPPEIFYNAAEARKYTVSTRIQKIQRQMTLRALELLNLPKFDGGHAAAFLLDVGCGSGISSDVLMEQGHSCVGVDISSDMLRLAKREELRHYGVTLDAEAAAEDAERQRLRASATRVDTSHVKWGLITSGSSSGGSDDGDDDAERDDEEDDAGGVAGAESTDRIATVVQAPQVVEVVNSDIGAGVPFRPGSFDGCISVSVIQWLCHSTKKGEVPQRRLLKLFQSLYNALRRGAKAVFQFYPSSPDQVHMITRAAMKCGFNGGVVVDYPNSARAKKYYLVLQAGQVAGGFELPVALTSDVAEGDDEERSEEEEEDYDEDYDDDDEAHGERGRDRIHIGGRDSSTNKRSRAASAHARKRRRADNRPEAGSRDWVLLKKEERRRRGYSTTADSKYTMRRRKPRF